MRMASTNQLKAGYFLPAVVAKAKWMKHNHLVNRDVKTLQNSSKNGCQYLSVSCYSAPTKGWHKTHYGCRAHIHLIGTDPEDVCITSVDLQHTSWLVEDAQQKRNYQMKDIANLSDAVALYQPTASSREGNAKQLKEIARVATSFEVGRTQAYRSIHERSHDTIHAQIGQYMLLPDLFRSLTEQDPNGSQVLECRQCEWDDEKQ